MIINIIRAMMYFLVVGVQIVHCFTGGTPCSAMIVLVPLFLGVMDTILIWGSARDTMGVRIGAIALAAVSITVAIDTLAPILYGPRPLTDYLFFMYYLSLGIIFVSIIEFVVVVFDLMSPKDRLDDLRLLNSTRTY